MDDRFSDIVSKVLSGEASAVEKRELQEMIIQSSESAVLYEKIKEYWNAELKSTTSTSVEELIFDKIERQNKTATVKRLYFRVASAAAVFLLLVSTTFGLLYFLNSGKSEYIYVAQQTPVDYTMSDGTQIKLNKNSSIAFRSDYNQSFRNVTLKGEAFFQVTKDPSKPFIVEALGTKTKVLGTSFNVNADELNQTVTTTLVTGSVQFVSSGCDVKLEPGHVVIYQVDSKKYDSVPIDVQYNTAWITGRYNYVAIRFGDLVKKLADIYKVKIYVRDEKIANRVITVSLLMDEPLDSILAGLKKELGFCYTTNSDVVVITNINP